MTEPDQVPPPGGTAAGDPPEPVPAEDPAETARQETSTQEIARQETARQEIARRDSAWAAQGDRFEARRLGQMTSQAAAPGPAGSDNAIGVAPYRTPKHLRTTSGPRFSGRGVFAVFGLLGIVLTLGIMAFLAVKVLDATPGTGSGLSGTQVGPEAPDVPDGSVGDPGASTDAAAAAACQGERSTIEVVIQGYEVLHGSPPANLEALISEGLLDPPEEGLSFELSGGGTLTGVGSCAGM